MDATATATAAANPEPLFVVDFDDDMGRYPLSGMLRQNSASEALCAWLRSANVGDVWRDFTSVTRVA